MRAFVRPVLVFLLCGFAAMAAQALELAKYPQVLTGPKGIEVVLAPSTDGKQALMQVSGVNHPIDQVVFLGTLEIRGAGREVYATQIDGVHYGLVQKETRSYGGGEQYVVYLPGTRDGIHLSFDEKKSKAFKLPSLQASYTEQQKKGVQEKLARFDRSKRQASLQAELAKGDQEASNACAAKIETLVDWPTIDDEKLQTLSISSFCGAVASEMESLCRAKPDFKAVATKLSRVRCQFASSLKIRVDNNEVIFNTEKDAPNQGEFVRQFLRNQ